MIQVYNPYQLFDEMPEPIIKVSALVKNIEISDFFDYLSILKVSALVKSNEISDFLLLFNYIKSICTCEEY